MLHRQITLEKSRAREGPFLFSSVTYTTHDRIIGEIKLRSRLVQGLMGRKAKAETSLRVEKC